VILEVEWEDTYTERQVERVVPVYNKTYVAGLQISLSDKFTYGQATAETWRRYGIISKI
jgi:hypothetical protein